MMREKSNFSLASDSGEHSPVLSSRDDSPLIHNEGINSDTDNIGINESKAPSTVHLTTSNESLMHLIKGNVGVGILAMPYAISKAGLVVGTVGLGIMSVLCVHCMHILVNCYNILSKKSGIVALDYSDVVGLAFENGPPRLRKLAPWAKTFIDAFVIITQFGFAITYFVFSAKNIKQVIEQHTGGALASQIYMLCLLPLMILYNTLGNLKYLAPFSTIANIITGSGLGIIMYCVLQNLHPVNSFPAFASFSTLPIYFGTAIFAFEGIGIILPIQNKMKHPEEFGPWNGVLNTGMVLVTVLYMTIGFYGYLRFGDGVASVITLSLPQDQILYQVVKLMFAVAIFVSYAIQLYVPVEIMWPFFQRKVFYRIPEPWAKHIYRTLLVIFTFGVAAAVPDIGLFVSLVGAVSSSMLALIIPPILEMVTYWPDHYGVCMWRITKNIIILVTGLVGFTTGTYVSFHDIVEAFTNPNSNNN